MKAIVINNQELEVIQLTPFAYMSGKGEKVLQIKVAEEVAGFNVLKELLDGNTGAIKYYEGEAFKCEYNGYSVFECTYANGVFDIELKKGTLVDQVTALHNANETLSKAVNTLELANAALAESNAALAESNEAQAATIELLAEQNAMLEECILEMSEVIYADEEYTEEEYTEEGQDNGSEIVGE